MTVQQVTEVKASDVLVIVDDTDICVRLLHFGCLALHWSFSYARSRMGGSWRTSLSVLSTSASCVPWLEFLRKICRPLRDVVSPAFSGLLLPRLPSTVPCTITLVRPSDLVTCPYHFSCRRFTVVRRSSHVPMCFMMVFRMLPLVIRSL